MGEQHMANLTKMDNKENTFNCTPNESKNNPALCTKNQNVHSYAYKIPKSFTSLFIDEFSLWAAANDGVVGFFSSPTPYTKDTQQNIRVQTDIQKYSHRCLALILINQASHLRMKT
jgi:hypothetical protein